MEYGYEKVLEVQRRCGITFEEADRAMKAEKGNVDKACAYAMRKKKAPNGWFKKIYAHNLLVYVDRIFSTNRLSGFLRVFLQRWDYRGCAWFAHSRGHICVLQCPSWRVCYCFI